MLLIQVQLSSKVPFQLGKGLVHLAWGLCQVFFSNMYFVVLVFFLETLAGEILFGA